MLVVLVVLAAWFFGWRALSARLGRTDRELRALEARFEKLDARLSAETTAEIRSDSTTVAHSPLPTSEGPREDRDLVAALIGGPHVPARPATAQAAAQGQESLETIIGSRWLLYVGIVAVIVGTSYFIKLAFDNHWINETARVSMGAVVGVLLAYGGLHFVRAGYSLYGQSISGGGVAILYLSIYAAFDFYHLIAQAPAFALMCAVTMAAAWLADRQGSEALALMAVGGGFATPFLLASGRDAEIALFTYDAVLVAGTMFLARRREWPWLNLLSYIGVVLTVMGWAVTFYAHDKFLTTEVFLTLFCAMFLYLVYESRLSVAPEARRVRDILRSGPAFYYLASLAVLYDHGMAFLIFLMLIHVVGIAAARQYRSSRIRLVSWIAAIAPLALWIAGHSTAGWFVPGLVVVAGLYAITLVAQLDAIVRDSCRLDDTDVGLVHANALVAYGCAYMLVDAIHPFAATPAALAFAVWQLVLAGPLAIRDRDDALHFVGVAFTLTSVATAIQWQGAGAVVGWTAEGAAAMWLGLHERRAWLRVGGAALLAVAIAALVALQLDPPYLGQMVFMNRRALAGAFVVAALSGVAALYRRSPVEGDRGVRPRDVLLVTANALTLLVLTKEISSFWNLREPFLASPALARDARLSREAMISMTWAAYATGMIVAGLRRHYAPIRYFAIVVFGCTILKVFMVDLAALDRIYRVASIIGLGVLLLITSYLYQRARAVRAT
jgi:uncharacterized membrane protein